MFMNNKEIGEFVKKSSDPTASRELAVRVGAEIKKAFLQGGFYKNAGKQFLHFHSYAEIHLFLGKVQLHIDDKEHLLSGANIAVIPKNVYHSFHIAPGSRHAAFQIDLDINTVIADVSEDIAREFFLEVQRSLETENYSRLSAFISFLTSYFMPSDEGRTTRKVTDYAFLINDFFSLRYVENVTLADLAEHLCVSEKQAHRLVLKHLNKTFGKELTVRRMKIADHLMKEGKFSLTDIAEKVGYQTYSGFWKAYKRYKAMSDDQSHEYAALSDGVDL